MNNPNTLVELLRSKTELYPDKRLFTFLQDGETEECHLSYSELDQRAKTIAAKLQDLKAKGERAILLFPPGLDYISAFMGCLYAGVIAVPVYPPDPFKLHQTLPRLQGIVADSQAKIVLTTDIVLSISEVIFHEAPALKELNWISTEGLTGLNNDWVPPETKPNDIAFLQYTSGSTGAPKGVMLSHSNLIHNCSLITECFEMNPQNKGLSWLPPYSNMGLIGGILQPIFAETATVLLSPLHILQNPLRWLKAISRYQINVCGGPNFAYDLCANKMTSLGDSALPEKLDLSSWCLAFTGSETVKIDSLKRFIATFEPFGFKMEAFYPCYGLSESTLIVTGGKKSTPIKKINVDPASLQQNTVRQVGLEDKSNYLISTGTALRDGTVIIVDPKTETELPEDHIGEVWLQGPSIAQGYWNKPKETLETFKVRLKGSETAPYLRTGDLGFIHDGYLFITGRSKEIIIIRGQNYYPYDIEQSAEKSHPAIRTGCGAAFSAGTTGDEKLVIVYEFERRAANQNVPPEIIDRRRPQPEIDAFTPDLKQSDDPKEVIRLIRSQIAKYFNLKVSDIILIKAGTIPKTPNGKVQRLICKSLYLKGELEVISAESA